MFVEAKKRELTILPVLYFFFKRLDSVQFQRTWLLTTSVVYNVVYRNALGCMAKPDIVRFPWREFFKGYLLPNFAFLQFRYPHIFVPVEVLYFENLKIQELVLFL